AVRVDGEVDDVEGVAVSVGLLGRHDCARVNSKDFAVPVNTLHLQIGLMLVPRDKDSGPRLQKAPAFFLIRQPTHRMMNEDDVFEAIFTVDYALFRSQEQPAWFLILFAASA